MSSESDFEALRRERLSALVDGELDLPGSADACAFWRGSDGVRQDWHAWHLIGDVLRSDDLASNASRDLRFLAVVRERLAVEPVLLAPQPGLAAASGRQRSALAAFGHWPLSGAVAAGFVLVVGAFVMTRPAGDAGLPGIVAVADSSTGDPAVASPAVTRPTVFAVSRGDAVGNGPDRQMIRNAHLDRYLEAHKQFAGSSALGVPSAFLSNATVDSATR